MAVLVLGRKKRQPLIPCSEKRDRLLLERGFQTGDMAPATIVAGKKTGIHVGRVAVRASGSFNIQTVTAVAQGINAKRCKLIQRGDGYSYGYRSGASSPKER
ncbi:MAG: hypothetical protein J2P21_11540 [Chloracidobacterium sp.]|nr:hypothetical protein [Chloracidobacterium sp.]